MPSRSPPHLDLPGRLFTGRHTTPCSPDSASRGKACNNNVVFPIPGSPPINMTEPGTTPPPRTRSKLAHSVLCLGSPRFDIGDGGGDRPWPPSRGLPCRPFGAGASRSSLKLFHPPQSGQRPEPTRGLVAACLAMKRRFCLVQFRLTFPALPIGIVKETDEKRKAVGKLDMSPRGLVVKTGVTVVRARDA